VILSHDYQFIYIRCHKTASTSIELALSRVCGHSDIVTPICTPEDEALRPQLGGRGPQNYLNADGTHRFYNHMPASEVRLLVGQRVWDSIINGAWNGIRGTRCSPTTTTVTATQPHDRRCTRSSNRAVPNG